MIPPVVALNEMLTGWLNGLNGTNAILLGLILGGMMAIDMGGPINKAAFTFGIAAIEAQNFGVHSAVMAGGMVPPLAIAFATTFFKSKFTEAERKSGLTNYIMGASFITEGAIPFAAARSGSSNCKLCCWFKYCRCVIYVIPNYITSTAWWIICNSVSK